MTGKQFEKKLKELYKARPTSDFRLDLYYQGNLVGCIEGAGLLSEVVYDEYDSYLLIQDNTFSVFVDGAELRGI